MKLIKCSAILVILVTGFVMPESYNGVRIKFYENMPGCYDTLDKIPEIYFEDLVQISFLGKSNRLGVYWWSTGVIYMYGNCELEVLIHELAHHQQYLRGDSFYNASNHKGNFLEYYYEINKSIEV